MNRWSIALMLGLVACGGAKRPPVVTPVDPTPPPAVEAAPAAPKAPVAPAAPAEDDDDAEAQMVVGREVIARCPVLQLVRQHAGEFPEDRLWLVVLQAIGECMRPGGTLAAQNIGVSGGPSALTVVRDVLSARGIDPARVQGTADPQGMPGVAAITILAPGGQQD